MGDEPSMPSQVGAVTRTASGREGRPLNLLALSLLALVIGAATGVGAAAFRWLIAFVHNLAFYGHLSFVYDANRLEPPSPWGPLVVLVPIIGGLIVVFLVRRYAPEAKGHGVPEVMDAVFYKSGQIRGRVAVIKSLASALSIGTGASVGREGPIVQIGSALGSTLARLVDLASAQRVTLIAAGAGAGIAATFNTPLGGVMFALELLLPVVSARTFLPVVIATGTATYVGRILIGAEPAFVVPAMQLAARGLIAPTEAVAFAVLGVLCGIAAWAFIRLLALMEDLFPRLAGNEYVQNAIGMGALGVLYYLLALAFGHMYVEGVGYGTVQAILNGGMTGIGLLMLLFFAKLVATTVSLGCGASGGIFSPALFMGATLGAAFGGLVALMLPGSTSLVPGEMALVGMGAIVGAATGAPLTGIVMIFEMTRDYAIIVPLVIAVAIAVGVRQTLLEDTIYTIKLRRRGHRIPQDRQSELFLVQSAGAVMATDFVTLPADLPLETALQRMAERKCRFAILAEGRRIKGFIGPDSDTLQAYLRDRRQAVGAIAQRDFRLAQPDDLIEGVIIRLKRRGCSVALVVGGRGIPRVEDVLGIVSKTAIAEAVIRGHPGS